MSVGLAIGPPADEVPQGDSPTAGPSVPALYPPSAPPMSPSAPPMSPNAPPQSPNAPPMSPGTFFQPQTASPHTPSSSSLSSQLSSSQSQDPDWASTNEFANLLRKEKIDQACKLQNNVVDQFVLIYPTFLLAVGTCQCGRWKSISVGRPMEHCDTKTSQTSEGLLRCQHLFRACNHCLQS